MYVIYTWTDVQLHKSHVTPGMTNCITVNATEHAKRHCIFEVFADCFVFYNLYTHILMYNVSYTYLVPLFKKATG